MLGVRRGRPVSGAPYPPRRRLRPRPPARLRHSESGLTFRVPWPPPLPTKGLVDSPDSATKRPSGGGSPRHGCRGAPQYTASSCPPPPPAFSGGSGTPRPDAPVRLRARLPDDRNLALPIARHVYRRPTGERIAGVSTTWRALRSWLLEARVHAPAGTTPASTMVRSHSCLAKS